MAGEIKHEWNGTILTISSDRGVSSMDLKGSRGDTGPRGPQGRPGIIINADGSIDMTDYATETFVNEKLALDYYTKTEVEDVIASATGVDMSNYYTKFETVETIENYVPDLTPYALKSELPTSVSDFVNDAGYQTETQVELLIKAALDAIGVAEGGAY